MEQKFYVKYDEDTEHTEVTASSMNDALMTWLALQGKTSAMDISNGFSGWDDGCIEVLTEEEYKEFINHTGLEDPETNDAPGEVYVGKLTTMKVDNVEVVTITPRPGDVGKLTNLTMQLKKHANQVVKVTVDVVARG